MRIIDKIKSIFNGASLAPEHAPDIEFFPDLPSEDKQDVLKKFVQDRYEMAFKYIEPMKSEWDSNRRAYMGETHDNYQGKGSQYVPEADRAIYSSCVVADKIESVISIHANGIPKIYPMPKHIPDDALYAGFTNPDGSPVQPGIFVKDIWAKCIEDMEERLDMKELDQATLLDSRLCHYAIVKIYAGYNWLGDKDKEVFISPVQPDDFAVDPSATSFKQAKYAFHRIPMTVYDALAMWPDKQDAIIKALRGKDDKNLSPGYDKAGVRIKKNRIDIVEGYFRDNTMQKKQGTPEAVTDEATGEESLKAKFDWVKKYPTGRRITFIDIDGQAEVLEDKPNPYRDFPFEIFRPHAISWRIQGRCEATALRSLQYMKDNAVQQMYGNLKQHGNGVLIGRKHDLENLSNLIGTTVQSDNPGSMQFFKAGNILGEGFNMTRMLDMDADQISGVNEPAEGAPSSTSSGRAIRMLQESTNRKVRPAQENFAEFKKRVYTQAAWIMMGTYEKGRVLNVSDDDNLPYTLPVGLAEVTESIDMKADTESQFPLDPMGKLNFLLQFAQIPGPDGRPVLDVQTLLEMSKFPGVKDILTRRAAEAQQAMAMQAQQQMMTQPGAGAPFNPSGQGGSPPAPVGMMSPAQTDQQDFMNTQPQGGM